MKRNYRILNDYHKGSEDEDICELNEELWGDRDASFFEPLFGNYSNWFKKSIEPRLDRIEVKYCQLSHFPGDLCIELIPKGRFPLCIVGLNSAWMQYCDSEFKGRLELPTRQFHAALRDNDTTQPLDILAPGKRNLLMIHHPPDWLSRQSLDNFNEAIYTPDRFDLCLFGHVHKGRSECVAYAGGKLRYYFQCPSLLGLKHYRTKNEDRATGYAWGHLRANGSVHVWPLERVTRGGGEAVFDFDQSFTGDKGNGVQIRPLPQDSTERDIPAMDLTPWLESLLDQTSHINISGIGTAPGKVKTASRYPIEQLYTTLRSRVELHGHRGTMDLGLTAESVSLETLLPRYQKLLIEGQPGAGKTTFIRYVVCMLVRDQLGIGCPDGGTWCGHYLGLESKERLPIPVFLRLGGFASLLLSPGTILQHNTRERLLDLLVNSVDNEIVSIPRDYWRGMFERGDAMLLLDGMDEVADEDLRQRVLAILRDVCKYWDKCPIVITSRPVQTMVMREIGFHPVTIEPFADTEIRTFIYRWVSALHQSGIQGRVHTVADDYHQRLLAAIVERPRIRRMATNPVMLTCLCVVHWNEGELPEGRSRVYGAVLRWLIAARSENRAKCGFTDRFAQRAFALLALRMMADEQGK